MSCSYTLPRLVELNAASRILRERRRLLIASRCLECEHPKVLKPFLDRYAVATACLEEEHVNVLGFKLLGILGRVELEEVVVLTVDGSMHCVQLHFMVEEVFKLLQPRARRRHLVSVRGRVVEVSQQAVKIARYLSRIENMLSRAATG